tara:strand:+ start:2821 stop:3048 length:228 start_codon:yes stop_codon:yes gene_type:complete
MLHQKVIFARMALGWIKIKIQTDRQFLHPVFNSSNLFSFMDKRLLLQNLIKLHLKRTFLESGWLKVSILKAFTSS